MTTPGSALISSDACPDEAPRKCGFRLSGKREDGKPNHAKEMIAEDRRTGESPWRSAFISFISSNKSRAGLDAGSTGRRSDGESVERGGGYVQSRAGAIALSASAATPGIDAVHAASFKDFLLNCWELKEQMVTKVKYRKTGRKIEVEGKMVAEKESYSEEVLECKPHVRVPSGVLEALIEAGAMNTLCEDREKLKMLLPPLLEIAKKYMAKECAFRNGSTRGITPAQLRQQIEDYQIDDCDVRILTLEETLRIERAMTGCYLTQSPFEPFRRVLRQCDFESIENIRANDYGRNAMFPGILADFREIVIKNGKHKGRTMAFMSFNGVDGDVGVVAFSDAWEAINRPIEGTATPIVERGKVPAAARWRPHDGRVRGDGEGLLQKAEM